MQNRLLKIVPYLYVLLLLFNALQVTGQSLAYHLSQADSLFAQKRYTQSLVLYRSIFNQKQYTPSMFLKMAYIEEGLDRLAPAVYYLNLYYLASHDDRVVSKIKDLAVKHRLEGYEFSDRDQIYSAYQEHHTQLSIALITLSLFLLSLIFFFRYRRKRAIGTWISLLVTLIIFFIHSNQPIQYPSAIIASGNTYLMSGPSAGSSVVQIIGEGHRVYVIGQKDVWVKIRWQDRDAFVKEDNLLPLSL